MKTYHPTTVKNVLSAVKVQVKEGTIIREVSLEMLMGGSIALGENALKVYLDETIFHKSE